LTEDPALQKKALEQHLGWLPANLKVEKRQEEQ
jgi:hypothetical protein